MKKLLGKIHYNAPVILTFTLICVIVQAICTLPGTGWFHDIFMVYRRPFTNPKLYLGLFTHAIGHANWSHLIGNFTYILLLGPILEEKYGSHRMVAMMAFTAFITGLINVIFFPTTALLGASGIVFMLIILCSFTNTKKDGTIPLTLILVCISYIGREVLNAFGNDDISQMGHILGGICGAVFGFYFSGMKNENSSVIPY